MNRRRVAILALLAVCVHPASAVKDVPDPLPAIKVPCDLVQMADRAMIDRVGQEFYDRCLRFSGLRLHDQREVIDVVTWGQVRRERCSGGYRYSNRPPFWYEVSWQLRTDVAGSVVSLDIDPEGRVLNDPTRIRIPDCVNQPSECVFLIGQKDAIAIALELNVIEPNCYVGAQFRWSDEHSTFVWWCQQYGDPGTLTGPFPTVVIDANSGDILFAGLN